MPTNKQRREAERRRLQRQLEERRQREVARRRFTLISSIVGTLAVIVIVIVIVVATTGGNDAKPKKTKTPAAAATPTTSAPATSSAPLPTAACAAPGKASTASFKGVTVQYPTDLKREPKVRSKSSTNPAALVCEDLVVGKGKPAAPGAAVSVQYTGVLYANGKEFDSSWGKGGKPASFTLDPNQVIPGFNQGIGGAGKVAPMKIGGRRIIIMPASLAYGSQGNGAVPANASLVFVIDLKTVKG